MGLLNDELRIRLRGKKDKKGCDIYMGVVSIPASIDLNETLFMFFPDEHEDGMFGGDLVVRRYTGKRGARGDFEKSNADKEPASEE